jgi:hypothetical protein
VGECHVQRKYQNATSNLLLLLPLLLTCPSVLGSVRCSACAEAVAADIAAATAAAAAALLEEARSCESRR